MNFVSLNITGALLLVSFVVVRIVYRRKQNQRSLTQNKYLKPAVQAKPRLLDGRNPLPKSAKPSPSPPPLLAGSNPIPRTHAIIKRTRPYKVQNPAFDRYYIDYSKLDDQLFDTLEQIKYPEAPSLQVVIVIRCMPVQFSLDQLAEQGCIIQMEGIKPEFNLRISPELLAPLSFQGWIKQIKLRQPLCVNDDIETYV